jgi:membrane associated rhomboid family serine protease
MRPPDDWTKARLTLGLALVTAVAWLLAEIFRQQDFVAVAGGFWPGPERFRYGDSGGLFLSLWLTPISATLIHAGIPHLLLNVVILVFCGRHVEWALGWIGLLLLYLLGAYAAAGAQYLIDPAPLAPMVGASGAISAIIGAYAMLFGRNKVKVANPTLALWLNALWLMAAWVALQLCIGIVIEGSTFLTGGEGVQVAVAAHIGGFLIGLLLANPLLLFRYRKA